MAEIQATIEFSVELCKFYNVDLFQRGYYQIRTYLRAPQKVPVKVEVSLPRNCECNLIFPACIVNGAAISQTFQILYKNEEVLLNDVALFKIHLLVDSQKIEDSIDKTDFQLILELWFTDQPFGPEQHNSIMCVCSRTLDINFSSNCGLHHHLPVLFDYFHLCAVSVTIHAMTVAVHQPYLNVVKSNQQGWINNKPLSGNTRIQQPTLETVLFGPNKPLQGATNKYSVYEARIHNAWVVHRNICNILLSSYESLQTKLKEYMKLLPPWQQLKIETTDCHAKFHLICEIARTFKTEDELLETAASDIAQLCAENVLLWTQFLDLFTLNEKVRYVLARSHHLQRVKRFGEGFFVMENPRLSAISNYDNMVQSHVSIAEAIRKSVYWMNLPPLPVECVDVDGDPTTLPIIFEDQYQETTTDSNIDLNGIEVSVKDPKSHRKNSFKEKLRNSLKLDLKSSNSDCSSSKSKQKIKTRFGIKTAQLLRNMKPELLRRPLTGSRTEAVVLVGYRKIEQTTSMPLQLSTGSFSPVTPNIPLQRIKHAQSTLSMPIMNLSFSNNSLNMSSRSMPDLINSPKNIFPFSRCLKFARNSWGGSDANLSSDGETSTPISSKGSNTSSGRISNEGSEKSESDIVLINVHKDSISYSTNIEDPISSTTLKLESNSDCSSVFNSLNSVNSTKVSETYNNSQVSGSNCELKPIYNDCSVLSLPNLQNGQNIVSSLSKHDYSSLANTLSLALGGEDEQQTSQNREHEIINKISQVEQTLKKSQTDINSYGSLNGIPLPSRDSGNESQPNGSENSFMNIKCTVLEMFSTFSNQKDKNSLTNTSSKDRKHKCDDNGEIYLHESIPRVHLASPESLSPKDEDEENKSVKSSDPEKGSSSRSESSISSIDSVASYDAGQKLVSQVGIKIINFIKAKEDFKRTLNYGGHLYSDFPSLASTLPYFYRDERRSLCNNDGLHLIICVHGLDGNSVDLRLVRTYIELGLAGANLEFLMSERNQPDTFAEFDIMTARLVAEILYHIEVFRLNPSKISFVGHSLGTVLIRSALTKPEMKPWLSRLHTFLSLSGPHLGTLYNSSGLVNMGMWFMQKWKKSGSLLQLSMRDAADIQGTFLYKLSKKPGLENFKNILLVGSSQDRYVPFHSARMELCKAAIKDTSVQGGAYRDMVHNLLKKILDNPEIKLIRYDVHHALPNTANSLIGRAAHIAVLDSELFLEKFMTVSGVKYFR